MFGQPLTYVNPNQAGIRFKADYDHKVPMSAQNQYKYIVYVEGHSAANRYNYLMTLNSVILKVDSTVVAKDLWFFPLLTGISLDELRTVTSTRADHVRIDSHLGDLVAVVQFLREHDELAKQIAANAVAKHAKYLSRDYLLDYGALVLNRISNNRVAMHPKFVRPSMLILNTLPLI